MEKSLGVFQRRRKLCQLTATKGSNNCSIMLVDVKNIEINESCASFFHLSNE